MDFKNLDRAIYRRMQVIEELTGISSSLIFTAIEWHEPFFVTDHWKIAEGATSEEIWEENFHFPDFKRAKGYLVEVKNRGADVLYVACLILYLVDDNKRYEFVEATEEELREASDNLPATQTLRRIKQEDLPRLERTFGQRELVQLKKEIDTLLKSPRLRILRQTSSEPRSQIKPKVGRPAQYFWNMIMLLLSRHIAETFPLPRNRKPPRGYGYIAMLMSTCFPRVFGRSFGYETVRSRLLSFQKNSEVLAEAGALEKELHEIVTNIRERPSQVFLNAARQSMERPRRMRP